MRKSFQRYFKASVLLFYLGYGSVWAFLAVLAVTIGVFISKGLLIYIKYLWNLI